MTGAACAGAAIAVVTGAVPLQLLSALPARLINLLENDLLQALPLYVLMGLVLDRLPVTIELAAESMRVKWWVASAEPAVGVFTPAETCPGRRLVFTDAGAELIAGVAVTVEFPP